MACLSADQHALEFACVRCTRQKWHLNVVVTLNVSVVVRQFTVSSGRLSLLIVHSSLMLLGVTYKGKPQTRTLQHDFRNPSCIFVSLSCCVCRYEFQMQFGSIGWSVGATLGYAQALKGRKRVLASIGDGSFQVTAQVCYALCMLCSNRLFVLCCERPCCAVLALLIWVMLCLPCSYKLCSLVVPTCSALSVLCSQQDNSYLSPRGDVVPRFCVVASAGFVSVKGALHAFSQQST